MHWNPIFSGITASSVWRQPDHVRLAWIAILANKDFKTHKVRTNALILADQARISRDNAEDALRVLCSPDPDSLDPEFEGRRLEKLPAGGYLVLNGEKYSRLMAEFKKKEYDRDYAAERRAASKLANPEFNGEHHRPPEPEGPQPDPLEIPENLKTQPFTNAWQQWMTFRRGMKACKDWVTLFRKQLSWLSEMGPEIATECVNASIRNGWQGLFDPRLKKGNSKQPNGRQMTNDEIVRQAVS